MSVSLTPVPAPRSGDDSPDPGEPLKRPLTAVEERDLDALRFAWPEYDAGYSRGRFLACRLTGGDLLAGATPDELAAAIRADWAAGGTR